ncbi:hypothetical protein, partial [Klebsiella pneumoniae]|uniref:hypothetical protein n=1 Tax=Klebsiella pneumoniae TaxID=573 RepID=UPI003A854418
FAAPRQPLFGPDPPAAHRPKEAAPALVTELTAALAEGKPLQAKLRDDPMAAKQELFDQSGRMSRLYRRLETSGKPFVVAIGGTCMGGATELALAAGFTVG